MTIWATTAESILPPRKFCDFVKSKTSEEVVDLMIGCLIPKGNIDKQEITPGTQKLYQSVKAVL